MVTNNAIEKYIEVNIDLLVKADWNYKDEDAALTEKLAENIKRNGQIENIIIRELESGFFEVVNGNHRYDVLKKLNYSSVVAYNLGKISDAKAKKIAIETNETRFQTDNFKLGKLIDDIIKDGESTVAELSETIAFSQREIDAYLRLMNYDKDEVEANKRQTYDDILKRNNGEFDEDEENEFESTLQTPTIVGHPDVDDFNELVFSLGQVEEASKVKSKWITLLKAYRLSTDGSSDLKMFMILLDQTYKSLNLGDNNTTIDNTVLVNNLSKDLLIEST